MALQLETENPFGEIAPAAYWKIIESNINWQDKSCHIVMACWVNKDFRMDEKQPIKSESFDWSGDEYPYTVEAMNEKGINLVVITYNKIKSLTITDEKGNVLPGDFSSAIDV